MTVDSTGSHHPLYKQVVQAIRARKLLQPGQNVLVAVSGGPDSVALLSILHGLASAWKLSLTVVHCNYGLRGAESDGDASFVAALCARLDLPCVIRSLTINRGEGGARSSLQARAREARYSLFRDLAAELCGDRVALGHTADDQAETVLLRMLRGAGLRGLAGMPHIRGRLFIRPLLTVTRQQILSYLEIAGLPYRSDSSNAKPIYLRNRVRHELIPVMQSLAPAAVRMLARQADILRDDDRVLDALAVHRLARMTRSRDSTTIVLGRAGLLAQPLSLQRRIIRQAAQALSPSTTALRCDLLMSVVTSLASVRSGSVWKAGPLTVVCEQNQVRISTALPLPSGVGAAFDSACTDSPPSEDVVISSLPSTVSWPSTEAVIRMGSVPRERGLALLKKRSPAVAVLDADRLSLPLEIRTWHKGDWFCPSGMNGRRKKLQDYFTDAKLGRSVRERIPLMLSRDGIVWIVGERADARFVATPSTKRFIVGTVTSPARRKGAL